MSFRLFLDLLTGRKPRPSHGPSAYTPEEKTALLAIVVVSVVLYFVVRQLGWFKTEKVAPLDRDDDAG